MKIRLNWKGHVALMLFSVFMLVALGGAAQSPAPTVAPTVAASAPASTGLATWIKTQGGLVAAVGVVMACLNLILSSLATICSKLQLAEPAWMNAAGKFVGTIVAWFSANIPTPAPQVQAALTANSSTTTSSTSG